MDGLQRAVSASEGLYRRTTRLVMAGIVALLPMPAGGSDSLAEVDLVSWPISGGQASIRWNRELLDELGIAVVRAGDASQLPGSMGPSQAQALPTDIQRYTLDRDDALVIALGGGARIERFDAGRLKVATGFRLHIAGQTIDLADFRLQSTRPPGPALGLVDGNGNEWFRLVRPMYEISADRRALLISTMDLTLSRRLAEMTGRPEVASWTIADMQLSVNAAAMPAPVGMAENLHWPGDPAPDGGIYQVDLFMKSMHFQYMRCDGCSGINGSGHIVIAPSAVLRNNINGGSIQYTIENDPLGASTASWAAGVAWYAKFSGIFPPYQNDQHPYLIWNMYRINANGSIQQIGRSGLKHAYLTTNNNCADPDDHNYHVLGRGCEDTYTVSNNDNPLALAPRSEVIPFTGQWGRCGSVYDPQCIGSSSSPGYGAYDQRMVVPEAQLGGPQNAGATYLLEGWYVARDDINIDNSMATVAVVPLYDNGWSFNNQAQYRLGSAIDRWLHPSSPDSNTANVEIVTPEGRLKVAGKARFSLMTLWRYDYAFTNLDFSRPEQEGVEPNLRVISNEGIREIRIPIGSHSISGVSFRDADADPGNDWTVSQTDGWLVFTSPPGNRLDWGSLYSATFFSDQPPTSSNLTMAVARMGTPSHVLALGLPAPGDSLFQNGFDRP